jgi:hypothetical protein
VSVWSDIADLIQGVQGTATPAEQAQLAGSTPATLASGGVGDDLAAFFADLTDKKTWISLGWLALGILLLFLGAALWLKKEGALPSVIPLPVPV